MKFVLFYHSFVSCWNHGNAHFLRGLARALVAQGHEVVVYEPQEGWSWSNALADGGKHILAQAETLVPGVSLHAVDLAKLDLDEALQEADVVLVHEWNEPELVARIGAWRARSGEGTLLFHDTHHRAVTAPHEMQRFDLDGYDGVLAFGETLRAIYDGAGWGKRAFTWHEAADTALFRPLDAPKDLDLVWIGNWGDDERSQELQEFLITPARRLKLKTCIYGVRYPDAAQAALRNADIGFGGWLPNHAVPRVFAHARVTVHVPRRPYALALLGIPTIRVFEAMACGIPLVSAPWHDSEQLFPPDSYLRARTGEEMITALRRILADEDFACEMADKALATIRARHTCAHRAQELLQIVTNISTPNVAPRQQQHRHWPEAALQ